jgi:uncharacterized protein YkwD
MKLVLAFVVLLVLGVAPAAHAGPPIKNLGTCDAQDATYAQPDDATDFKAAVVCLISEIRKSQSLNVLRADAKLAKSAQGHATNQARAGALSHGKSVNEIPKRIARAGYKATALNEGLGIGISDQTAYEIVTSMMQDFACTEILDPRFRDVGVGVSLGKLRGAPGANYVHVVVHFGLKAGKKAPSTKQTAAKSCPHRLP